MTQSTDPTIQMSVVMSNEEIAPAIKEIVLNVPAVAASIRPGQFVHLRVASGTDVLLRRPFSVHRVEGECIRILYQIVGHGTEVLSTVPPGAVLDLIGPLGTGWQIADDVKRALLVAGGLGMAPMGMLVEELRTRGIAIMFILGAMTGEGLLGVDWLRTTCDHLELTTDDGTVGACGFVTAVLDDLITEYRPDVVFTCGPEPMQHAVAERVESYGVACQVSLERRMACGIGACLSCAVRTTSGLRRACVDGPVFNSCDVIWERVERNAT